MQRRSFLALPLTLPFSSSFSYSANGSPVRGLYGVSSTQAPFDEMSPAEVVAFLEAHSVNAVFVKSTEKPDVLKALGDAGIQRFVSQACFTGRSLYREHPEWRPITAEGKEMKPDLWYHGLSPTHPELRAYRLSQFETKVNNPLIDGVWLDFIRYPVRWEGDAPRIEEACFSSHSLAGFERFADIDLPDGSTEEVAAYILDSHPEVWLRYKCEVIRSWVAEAQSIMKTARPEMTLGLFMVPWLADDFDIAIERIVGQDAELLAPHVDVISPMLYHRMIHRPLERITTVVNSVQERTGAYVWPITQAMSEPDTLSTEEFREAIRIGVEASGSGVLVFGANHVENEQRWEQLQEVFTAID